MFLQACRDLSCKGETAEYRCYVSVIYETKVKVSQTRKGNTLAGFFQLVSGLPIPGFSTFF